MDQKKIINLEKKIAALEEDLVLKERDLLRYKTELTKANKTLEKLIGQVSQELKVAHLIQRALVPTEYPNMNGVEFSTKFIAGYKRGGNYFDIFEHEDKLKFGILLSSSSGYAMSALFLTVLLKLSSQIEARKGKAPHHVVESMVKEITPQMLENDQSSIFYGVIDRRSFEMQYCHIGQNTVIAVDGETGKLTSILPQAPALTKNLKPDLSLQTMLLNPKDRLVLCSDGLLKVQNSQGESFGLERLTQSILKAPRNGVHELRNEILYQIEKFTENSECPEDITLIVSEVKDRVLKLARN
jgi:sigma-B regulation protein RsbU (phosphoserine phosphatase)